MSCQCTAGQLLCLVLYHRQLCLNKVRPAVTVQHVPAASTTSPTTLCKSDCSCCTVADQRLRSPPSPPISLSARCNLTWQSATCSRWTGVERHVGSGWCLHTTVHNQGATKLTTCQYAGVFWLSQHSTKYNMYAQACIDVWSLHNSCPKGQATCSGPCQVNCYCTRTCAAKVAFLAVASSYCASSVAIFSCTATRRACALANSARVLSKDSCAAASAARVGATCSWPRHTGEQAARIGL